MARSLTVKHEENASVSPLLIGFLLIAAGWLLLSALFASEADASVSAPDAPEIAISFE